MAPTQVDHRATTTQDVPIAQHRDSNRVVISGMSGLFPKSHSIKDLSDILYNKINPVEPTSRFVSQHPEVVQYAGTVPGLKKFDAQFFKVHYRLANCMDPMSRKVLEQSYQAIYDAGINPDELSGKKVGVYIGSCFSETEKACFYDLFTRTGFGISGCNKSMFANRISYWLNVKGPSMSIDEACCSSTAALEQAFLAITRGECEAAIVGGSFLCLHPQSSVHYGRLLKLSNEDKTRSFDERANGFVKSESVNVLFLQRAETALRIYADLLYVKTEFTCMIPTETGPKYGFSREHNSVADFLKKFYQDIKVSPQVVEYVEAFGSAIPEVDKQELEAIEEIFCKNRNNTLMIGSIMSNIGYSEAASGTSAVIKVLLGYHYGKLAGNLHCEQPRKDIPALCDGRMRIVNENESFNGTYAAVNGMSITGVNSHILLHGYRKPKDLNRYKTNIPYLVNISGRHEEAVKYVLEILKSNPLDPEQLALLHNIHQTSVSGHIGRGVIILRSDEDQKAISLFENTEFFDDKKRPLWFVYSGMGSQWAGMGASLMSIPIFAAAIERCRRTLEPKGLDIVEIITKQDETIFNNILHSFVGIAAIQIGLTDILHAIGIKPHGIIGHSVGELGCAYADGCLTAEEMILAAYYRGLVSLETKFIQGSMAAVGMGYKDISKICPPEIQVACHNGPESSTISGPADAMRTFVAELTQKHIFAKEVPCSNIAYHSRYIADAGPGLLKYLEKAITDPKPRSKRWLSSSVPENKWHEPIAKLCSAEYLTNNLLSPVLFDETSQLIPKNAILVEIAPHGLLQAILKRSMADNCVNIALTRRNHPDNVLLLLQGIGKLFMEGYNSNLQALYPKVEMPVSIGTPFLSHFVKWAHDEIWSLALHRSADRKFAPISNFVLALHDKEQSYLQGHLLRGKILYPFSASLMLAWDTLAMTIGSKKKSFSVEFKDLHLYTQPIMHNRRQLKLQVAINTGTGCFEILEGNSKVVTGYIRPSFSIKVKEENLRSKRYFTLEDVYAMLSERDYSYSGEFQAIESVDELLNTAQIKWNDNWVTFLEGILQLNMLRQSHDAVSLPTRIKRITIDTKLHNNIINNTSFSNNTILLVAEIIENSQNTRCGGVLIENIMFRNLPKVHNKMNLKTLRFISNFETELNVSSSLEVYLQIIADTVNKNTITVIGIPFSNKKAHIFNAINDASKNMFGLNIIYTQMDAETDITNYNFDNVDLILMQDLSNNESVRQKLQQVIRKDQFIVTEEKLKSGDASSPISQCHVISIHCFEQYELQLVRWQTSKPCATSTTTSLRSVADFDFDKSGLLGGEFYLPVTTELADVKLECAEFGGCNSLHWVESSELITPGIDVSVHFAGVNTSDVKKANGLFLSKQNIANNYGLDFSGITDSGERVMGIVSGGALSTKVRAQPELLWPVPAYWSLEEAATVPLAYAQAFYCLAIKTKVYKGRSALVHGGAGALGQAVINILLALNCEVFTTVSDLSKKQFLLKLFPDLKADHIGCSRDGTFGSMVLNANKHGCDIVISCLKGYLKNVNMNCMKFGGMCCDISQLENHDNFIFGMSHLNHERNYICLDFSVLFDTVNNMEDIMHINKMMSDGIASGVVRPLSYVTYEPQEVARAFRLVESSQHRGRVLLRMNNNTLQEQNRLLCKSDCCHLILCNYINFGVQFANMLVSRGVKKIYMHVPTQSSYLKRKIRIWQTSGVEVVVISDKLEELKDVYGLLYKILHLGNLEGVYITTVENNENIQNIIFNLDTASRALCHDLRYFAVINLGDHSVGKDVCDRRVCDNLPAKILLLPELKNELTAGNVFGAVDAAERALQTSHSVLFAHTKQEPKPTILQRIASISDITIPNGADKSLTLQELGIDSLKEHKLEIISSALQLHYNLAFDKEEIPFLTLKTILELEKSVTELPYEDSKGLGTFFSYIDTDEMVSTTELVILPTLVSSASMRDDEFDPNQKHIYIIPGMEGHHERFRILCERLKLHAAVLQPGLDNLCENVHETAERFAKVLLKRNEVKGTFYLLGYESGVHVALALAAILEDNGLTGIVYCLGCSPTDLQKEIEVQLAEYKTEEQLCDAVVKHMFALMVDNNDVELDFELRNMTSQSEKIDAGVRALLGRVSHSAQYARALITSALTRIEQFRRFNPTPRLLRSQVVFLQAKTTAATSQHTTTSLQQYSEQPVIVHQLETSLGHCTADLCCANIINEYLGKEVLDDFSERNICDSYLLNPNAFMCVVNETE